MINNIDHSSAHITLKINIPDKGIYEKRFTFNPEDKVWAAKEQVIHEIGKELKDIQNYGFFVPPRQGKAGKFMDEGRPLSEYSIPGNEQILEFMLKRRIYRSLSFDENKLTKIHTKANLKKLMELVDQNNAGQVNQFLEKGLDPNYQDPKTGETPLTAAAVKNNANEVIMFLINGGAYFDFKNRNGLTAVHKAAIAGNSHNIKAFLDLGASPNYRDLKGLTPLYHACLSGKNPNVAELLLGDQAEIGVVDSQGWQEIHQVCRYGHVQHLEQLIYYGAEINAQNGSGNTPLHICSLYNQEDCARLLLYRGARRDIVNFANQTAEMVAVVATNASLSVFIRNYSESEVVPYIDKPTYSTRRRTQAKGRPTANSAFLRDSTDTFIFCSESLSTTSSTPSIHSENSEPMSLDLSPREIIPQVSVTEPDESPSRKPRRRRTLSGSGSDSSYASDSADEGGSNLTPVKSPSSDELSLRWRTYSLSSLNKEERGNIPRVKEVKGAANMGHIPGKRNLRKMYVAITNFTPTQAGELSLAEGDLVEVITKGEKGYWQGSVSGKTGWFPAECVEDLKKRKHNKSKSTLHKPASIASSLNKSNTSLDQSYVPPVVVTPQPRQVILYKVKAGFGFQMRGANIPAVNKLEFQPSAKIPALQYVGDVEPGGEAEKRGVKKGDYILEVNGNDVKTASHRHVVSLIRKTGQSLVMKLISIDNGEHFQKPSNNVVKAPASPNQDKPDAVIVNGTSHVDGNVEKKPPPIPSRAPTTSLTSRTKSERISVTDVDYEKPSVVQEDRIISVPRERISSTEQQWHSPLTGYSSLPRRPKSSYGAIIGSPHASPSDDTPRNFHPVETVDNTGFTTLPSKSNAKEATSRFVSQDDSSVTRKRPSSARLARERPKSWMPKVLPSEPPPISPPIPREQPPPRPSVDSKPVARTDSKREKKKRFSFRKKKEKDYMATSAPAPTDPAEELGNEAQTTTNDTTESLQIEDEEARPSSLPGLHKRLSTFKPVTVPHKQFVPTDVVSPELSQALEKRKSRGLSSSTDETVSPVFSPAHNAPVSVFPPPPSQSPPTPPKAKSLEDSIKEEMMRRRSNTAPASSIPAKPRRTFEYKKANGDALPEGEEPPEEKVGLDSELAKAVARRAAKMTTTPKADTHIYENVQILNINATKEPRSSVEEPPTLTIEEKLKKLHLDGEVILPTKFKPPVAPPSAKNTKAKSPVASPNEKATSPGNVLPLNVSTHGKVPPKTLPKPKRKSTASDSGSDDVSPTSRPMTLPISTSPRNSSLPPPLLSPEMVATKLLDDVINEEVERSNWDTASWKDKDFSSGKSSPTFVPETTTTNAAAATNASAAGNNDTSPTAAGKKKYIYKITLVTEKQADSTEQTKSVTQVITRNPESDQIASPGGTELPPPPAQPPLEFLDESPMPAPVFTPPTSPASECVDLPEFIPPPPPSFSPPPPPEFSPPPPPLIEDNMSPSAANVNVETSSPQLPPPQEFQEIPSKPPPPLSEPTPTLPEIAVSQQPQPSPLVKEPSLPAEQKPVNPPILQTDSEEIDYTSQLPAPVILPPNENVKNPEPLPTEGSPPPPKKKKSDQPAPEELVLPPRIFADDTDGHDVNSNKDSTTEKQVVDVKNDNSVAVSLDSEEVDAGNSKTSVLIGHEDVGSETKSLEQNVSVEITTEHPKLLVEQSLSETLQPQTKPEETMPLPERQEEVKDVQGNQSKTSEDELQSQATIKETEIDGSGNVVSPTDESSSQNVQAEEVQAPPESKDLNENVVEAPTANAGNKEELAPPKTAESDVPTDSSSFREAPYETWTCEHVCEWLASIGMAEHGDLFRENDIRGSNLLELSKEDLRELGVKKLGHRMTITNEVNRLTTNNGVATNI